MKAPTLVALLLLVLLGGAAPAGGDPLTAYHHRTATVTYPCREWVTLGSVPVPDRGQVTVSAQIPLEARSQHARDPVPAAAADGTAPATWTCS